MQAHTQVTLREYRSPHLAVRYEQPCDFATPTKASAIVCVMSHMLFSAPDLQSCASVASVILTLLTGLLCSSPSSNSLLGVGTLPVVSNLGGGLEEMVVASRDLRVLFVTVSGVTGVAGDVFSSTSVLSLEVVVLVSCFLVSLTGVFLKNDSTDCCFALAMVRFYGACFVSVVGVTVESASLFQMMWSQCASCNLRRVSLGWSCVKIDFLPVLIIHASRVNGREHLKWAKKVCTNAIT